MNKCLMCDIELLSDKAKTCSPRCRKLLSRQVSVTQNVSVTGPIETSVTFKFYTIAKAREPLPGIAKEEDIASSIRTAKYWYDVPLGAIPVMQKDWPAVPEFETDSGMEPMNGRQYFLWWKNNFEENDTGPVIHNPFPVRENVKYEMGGEGSRKWGA